MASSDPRATAGFDVSGTTFSVKNVLVDGSRSSALSTPPASPPTAGSRSVSPPAGTAPPALAGRRADVRVRPAAGHSPPEATGPGRQLLFVGVGYTGLRVLQRFRKRLTDQFGPPNGCRSSCTLYIDTDPDALAAAVAAPTPGLASLRPDDVFAARLNRAQHYLSYA